VIVVVGGTAGQTYVATAQVEDIPVVRTEAVATT